MKRTTKLGFLERTFPRWAAARARHRARTQHFKLMETSEDYRNTFFAVMNARGYRAAKTTKNSTPWLGGNSTADAQTINDLPTLISRSREINRDDPLGGGVTGTFVSNVIGTGMRPQARTGDSEKNKRLEEVWKERADSLTPGDDVTYGVHQKLVFRKVLEDGGVLVKESRAGTGEPVWFEIVEKDRIRMPLDVKSKDSEGAVIDGVEKDRYSRPVAYWVAKVKPKQTVGIALKAADFERVPKETASYARIVDRPGQTHGVPIFHAILQDLRDLDLLILAALKRSQISACLAAFIESPEATDDLFEGTAAKYHFQLNKTLEPGMIFKLYPGEKIHTLIPNFPSSEFEPFIFMLARRIGAALGISYQMVLKDFSKANYSSARTDLLESRQVFVGFQQWLISRIFDWEWRVVMQDAKLRGDARLRGISQDELSKVHWIPNGWKWVDPVKEAQATQIKLQVGLTTLRDECASQGNDWEEVMEQRLQEELLEIERRKALGLPPPTRITVLPQKKKGTLPIGEIDDDDEDDEERVAPAGKIEAPAFAFESRGVGLPKPGGNGEH